MNFLGGKGFSERGNLKTHVQKKICVRDDETTEKEFVCTNCGKGFTRHGNLEKHMIKCSTSKNRENHPELVDENSDVSKNNVCVIAANSGSRRPNDESKHLKCDLCEKKFRETDMLEKHIKIVHEKVKNYKCDRDNCEKEFM